MRRATTARGSALPQARQRGVIRRTLAFIDPAASCGFHFPVGDDLSILAGGRGQGQRAVPDRAIVVT